MIFNICHIREHITDTGQQSCAGYTRQKSPEKSNMPDALMDLVQVQAGNDRFQNILAI
jgi:hypothetical protein